MNSQNALSNMRLAVKGDIYCNSTLVLKRLDSTIVLLFIFAMPNYWLKQ